MPYLNRNRRSGKSLRNLIFVGVLTASTFTGSVAFADLIPILTQTDLAAIGTVGIKPLTGDYFLDFAGAELVLTAPAAGASTYIAGSFTGTLDGRGKTLSGLTAPLFDHLGTAGNGASVTDLVLEATGTSFVGHGILANDSNNVVIDTVSTEAIGVITSGNNDVGGLVGSAVDTKINDSSFTGEINSSGASIGGLVGFLDCSIKSGAVCETGTSVINDSHVTGELSGFYAIGGLVGGGYGDISNSHTDVIVSGGLYVGGIVGWSQVAIDQSYSAGTVTSTSVGDGAGGISGGQGTLTISNSYSTADVQGNNDVGGLVGYTYGDIKNSYATGNVSIVPSGTGNGIGGIVGWAYEATISDSYSTGNVSGISNTGGLVGEVVTSEIVNSFALGTTSRASGTANTVGSFVGVSTNSLHNSSNLTNSVSYDFPDVPTSKINLLNQGLGTTVWASCSAIIGGAPHLVSMRSTYSGSCTAAESNSGNEGNSQPLRRERIQKEIRDILEGGTPEKIEKTIGFESESPLPGDAGISFIDSVEKIDLTEVKTVEITPTTNAQVNTNTGEVLQISLKSKDNKPVELWMQLNDGKWCFTGLITFNTNGKAILPPLQLIVAGEYLLVLNRPSADSAKGSTPMDRISSLLVVIK